MRRSVLLGMTIALGAGLATVCLGAGCDGAGTVNAGPPHDGGPDGTLDGSVGLDAPGDAPPETAPCKVDCPVITGISITDNPLSVLSAVLTFTTDRPTTDQAHIANLGPTNAANVVDTPVSTALTTTHTINLLGMRASSTFDITISVTDASSRTTKAKASYTTRALPPFIPPITSVMNDKTRTSPGYTLMPVWVWDGKLLAFPDPNNSVLLAIDDEFQVVWYYQGSSTVTPGYPDAPVKLPSGNIAFIGGHQLWGEIDMMGKLIQLHTDTSMGLDSIHHELFLEADDILTLSTELRFVGGYPGGPHGTTQTLAIVGDQIVRMSLDGGVLNRWSDFAMLDPHYEGSVTQFQSNFWDSNYPDAGHTDDWTHGNAAARDPVDNGIIASSRTLSWIYKFRDDGGVPELEWRLGENGDFTLTNAGETFQYNQHAAYVLPDGHVMCFDDGNDRPGADGGIMDPTHRTSRAVEFALDTLNMTATIVWQYTESSQFYSGDLGSSYVLPNGNVLIDVGGLEAQPGTANQSPTNLKYARVMEVTHTMPPVKVAEFSINLPIGQYAPDPTYSGFSVYRARRIPSLY